MRRQPRDGDIGQICDECERGRMIYRDIDLSHIPEGVDPYKIDVETDYGFSNPYSRACDDQRLINGEGWYCESCMFYV